MNKDDPRLGQAEEYHRTVEGWDPGDAMVRSYTHGGETTHWVRLEDVLALVSVARGAADFLADGAADECDVAEALREALEPFEE